MKHRGLDTIHLAETLPPCPSSDGACGWKFALQVVTAADEALSAATPGGDGLRRRAMPGQDAQDEGKTKPPATPSPPARQDEPLR